MADYATFINSITEDVKEFKTRQAQGAASEEARCV